MSNRGGGNGVGIRHTVIIGHVCRGCAGERINSADIPGIGLGSVLESPASLATFPTLGEGQGGGNLCSSECGRASPSAGSCTGNR